VINFRKLNDVTPAINDVNIFIILVYK